ncbi:MAG: protein kinase [Nannocystaceae bacterium]|nr:protein kinase [Nannocystaceae bacterium]
MTDDDLTRRFDAARDTEDPLGARLAEARSAAALFGDDDVAVEIGGRYRLLQPLGSGGNGLVYAAHDRQLDREVAIKVLQRSRDEDPAARDRLLREARVLASLSHPGIVTVFDAGLTDGRVFVAMERVEGIDLARWLASEPRDVREILRTFHAAGLGLAAAHARGVIHRDFKPANVMVLPDGRAKVLDFGLARSDASAVARGGAASETAAAGTPRYMAPEQHRGELVDVRTDVYTFCAALTEALWGQLPWQGVAATELLARKLERVTLPRRAGVSERLRRLLLAGLTPTRERRPAALDPILAAMVPRRRAGALVGLAAVAGAVAFAIVPPRDDCERSGAAVASLWHADVAQALAAQLEARATPDATLHAQRIGAHLDRWTQRWAQARRDNCRATLVEHTQSASLMDARNLCLDTQLTELRTLLDNVGARDSAEAVTAAASLSPIDDCAAATLLARGHGTPPSPEVSTAEAAVAQARVLEDFGDLAGAEALVTPLLAADRERRDDGVEAQAEIVLGAVRFGQGRVDEATAALRRATLAAERSGDVQLRAHAWRALGLMLGVQRLQLDESLHALELSSQAGAQLPAGTREPFALEQAWGLVLTTHDRPSEALPHVERALALLDEQASDDPSDRAQATANLGFVFGRLGRLDDAEPLWLEAVATYEAELGPHHTHVILLLSNLGAAARAQGRLDEAAQRYATAIERVRSGDGERHPSYPDLLHNAGRLERERGRLDAALALLERARALQVERFGARSEQVAGEDIELGVTHERRGDGEAALRAFRSADAILGALDPVPARTKAIVEFNLATGMLAHDRAGALALARTAADRLVGVETGAAELATMRRWLDEHDPGGG